jgi:hypothetical protein
VSNTYISTSLRRLVARRAHQRCEYCLIHADDTFFGFHIDHIRSEKHGGNTTAENLAQACGPCNAYKGSDIATIQDEMLVELFHPRQQVWSEHFRFVGEIIEGLSITGRATAALLQMNHPRRLEERRATMSL